MNTYYNVYVVNFCKEPLKLFLGHFAQAKSSLKFEDFLLAASHLKRNSEVKSH